MLLVYIFLKHKELFQLSIQIITFLHVQEKIISDFPLLLLYLCLDQTQYYMQINIYSSYSGVTSCTLLHQMPPISPKRVYNELKRSVSNSPIKSTLNHQTYFQVHTIVKHWKVSCVMLLLLVLNYLL